MKAELKKELFEQELVALLEKYNMHLGIIFETDEVISHETESMKNATVYLTVYDEENDVEYGILKSGEVSFYDDQNIDNNQ